MRGVSEMGMAAKGRNIDQIPPRPGRDRGRGEGAAADAAGGRVQRTRGRAEG